MFDRFEKIWCKNGEVTGNWRESDRKLTGKWPETDLECSLELFGRLNNLKKDYFVHAPLGTSHHLLLFRSFHCQDQLKRKNDEKTTGIIKFELCTLRQSCWVEWQASMNDSMTSLVGWEVLLCWDCSNRLRQLSTAPSATWTRLIWRV